MTNKGFDTRVELPRDAQRGVALIVALLAITVLSGIGFALMLSSSTETLIHDNFRNSGLGLYASWAGTEEARGRLRGNIGAPPLRICGVLAAPGCPNSTPDTHLPAVNNALYIRFDNTVNPTDANCTFMRENCYDPDSPTTTNTLLSTAQTAGAGAVPYAWVKITRATQVKISLNLVDPAVDPTDDTTCVMYNGQNLYLDPACLYSPGENSPVYVYTSLAIEPGGTRRIVSELGAYRNLPGLNGPLTLNGPDPIFQSGSSNNYKIIGTDAGSQGENEAAIGVIDDTDIANVIAGIPANKMGDFPGEDPSPDIDNVSGEVNPLYQTCAGLTTLINMLTQVADHVYIGNQSGLPDPGTVANPKINVINGNLTITGDFTGAGILLVTGDLTFGGNSSYNGSIYVLGGSYLQNGAGSGQYNGGFFVTDITNCPTSLGSPSYVVNGGGNNGVQYNTDLTEPPGGNLPLQRLSFNY